MLRFMAQQSTPTAGLLLAQGEGDAGACVLRPGCQCISEAATPEGAHQAHAVKELVRTPGSVVSHRSLRIPDEASHRPV